MIEHIEMIRPVIEFHFIQTPKYIKRIAIGMSNEVYLVGLENKEIIARLSPIDRMLMGTHDHIPKFKALGIQVPDILAEDYNRRLIPYSYQILSKIEGKDLGQVIESLTETQLKALANEIANIFRKVSTIPSSDKFGVIWGGGDDEVSDSWTERMKIWIEESKERGLSTGIMDKDIVAIADKLYERFEAYFSNLKPTTYYGDICSKNVMIHQGAFNGLVDLDGLTQGDPLEAIGRIKLSWYETSYGDFYSTAIMDAMGLNQDQRKLVTMYALLNQISWACENGIQFNQNTTTFVDQAKKQRDKDVIMKLASELNFL